MDKLTKQPCPLCNKKTLTLTEEKKEIPYFGNVYLFSMICSSCHYNKSDVETETQNQPAKYTINVNSQKDMQIRIVKSSEATVKIPQLRMSVTPGPSSIGYISNIEGLLKRFEDIIEKEKELAEDPETKKRAKNLLKKIRKVKLGEIELKIIIEDPSGNSAIISKKAKIEKLK